MVKQESEGILPELEGKLGWTANTKMTSASIFLSGRFPPPIQALLEFSDNSVGFRNRDREYPTHIHAIIEPDRVCVLDYGGLGADGEGIKKFALVGETEDVGISIRGAGAKFAAWFFGEDLEISAKKRGDDVEYTSTIKGFGDPTIEYAGTFVINPKRSQWDLDRGRFEVIVKRIKSPDQLPQGANLRRVMGEVYRPLLSKLTADFRNPVKLDNRVILNSDGDLFEVNDKVIINVTTRSKREQVYPLNIPLLPGHSENNRKIIQTNLGEKMLVWVGEMDLRSPDSKNVKPGIRFYFDGRLINIDFLGFDEKDPRLSGLTGEVHLDNVLNIKEQLPANKSAGINLHSEQWQRVTSSLREFLYPFIEKLQQKTLQIPTNRPGYLAGVLSDARRYIDLCLREIAQEGVILTEEDLDLLVGETRAQRNSPREGHGDGGKRPTGRKSKNWIDQRPLTIATIDATVELPRRRKSFVGGTDLLSLSDTATVSKIISRENNSRQERILVLNSENPTVQAAIQIGKLAMARLAGEQIAEHVAFEFRSSIADALQLRDEIRLRHALVLAATPDYQKQSVSKQK